MNIVSVSFWRAASALVVTAHDLRGRLDRAIEDGSYWRYAGATAGASFLLGFGLVALARLIGLM